MAIQYIVQDTGQALLVGLSTDTKPVSPPDAFLFIESDTALMYTAVAGSWVVKTTGANLILTDVTTNDTSTTKHGFFPKLPTPTGKFLKDDLTWVAVSGTGDVVGPISSVTNRVVLFDGISGKLIKDSGLTLAGTNTGDQASIVGITGTVAQFNTAITDGDLATGGGTATGTNTGDQTSIVGITGTKAQFNTAVSDGDIVYLDSVDTITGVKTMSGLNAILTSSSGLTIRNPADTFKYTFTAGAIVADRVLTLPLTAGTLALTSDITGTNSGTNTGDQTSIVGITGTIAQFNTAITDGDLATGGGTATGTNTGDNAVNTLYSGLVSNATHTGDATGATALTVVKINGTTLSALATGVLKNTTTTGVPFISKVALTEPATAATLTIADNKTVTVNNTLTLAGTDSTTMTFPTTSATIARSDAANTFTGVQTFSSVPVFSAGIANADLPNGINNFNTARQSQIVVSATNYYITNSNINIPATLKAGMVVGTKFVWDVVMDKTAAGTGIFQISIYRGTNGSTADTQDVLQTIGTQTAAVDSMRFTVTLVVTATGASGSYYWSICPMTEAITATGFGVATGTTGQFSGTVSAVAMNTSALRFGLGFKATTGTPTISIPMVQAYALNLD